MPQHSEQPAAGFTRFPHRGFLAALALVAALVALALPAAALALPGPPIVSGSAFSEVTETAALLEATLNPHEKKTTYSFQYITQSNWVKDGNSFGPGTATAASGEIATGLAEAHQLSAALSGLDPGTLYRARLFAHNEKGDANEEVLLFATYPTPPPGLPDNRAYEQASPLNKDGGDVGGTADVVKAAADGQGAIFGSTAGVPGGVGAQELPLFAALRSPGGWLSGGLLPPAAIAQRARVLGWTTDFSRFYQRATLLGSPNATALYERSAAGVETQIAPYLPGVSYTYAGSSADGSKAVFETSAADLDEAKPGAEGKSNLYAWDGSAVHLASVLPGGAAAPAGAFAGPYDRVRGVTSEGGASAFAGGYFIQNERAVSADGSVFFTTALSGHIYQRRNPTAAEEGCADPAKACTLDVSGSHRTPPDPAGHVPAAFQAAAADGDTAFFTSPEELTDDANTGPEVEGPKIGRATIGAPPKEEAEEPLTELLKDHHAVGVAVSGAYVYWADPLNHAIGRAKLNGSSTPTVVEDPFIDLGGEAGETCAETHPETEPGEEQCAPSTPRYLALGPCAEGGEGQCLYWTNTGPLGGDLNLKQLHEPAAGAGTIGRARLDGSEALVPGSVDAEFVAGASDPRGIAANSKHLYWANSCADGDICEESDFSIARAAIDGSGAEQSFHKLGGTWALYGVALSATRVYWTMEETAGFGTVNSIPLEGGSQSSITTREGVAGDKPRGIAVIGPHVYWAGQGAEAIGRVNLELEKGSREEGFLEVKGSLGGLAADPAESHLYWSANGEVPPHPGSDLYRFRAPGTGGCAEAGGCLTDLAPLPGAAGAEVKGVVGASEDGTRLYFVANGVLAGNVVDNGAGPEEAQAGNCRPSVIGPAFGSGNCNLYEWEAAGGPAGTTSFVARLDANGEHLFSDDLDWAPTRLPTHEEPTARLSPDGRSLLFRSQRRLTAYENEGTPELYLYRVGSGITCVSCNPTMSPPQGQPGVGRVSPFQLKTELPAAVGSRLLASSGGRVLFETPDVLSAADQNGAVGTLDAEKKETCPDVGGFLQDGYLTCLDVYEWEAPGEGSCTEGGAGYSPANQGCLFLISTGKKRGYPALFADASESGGDVFFFDREGLVGQDQDQLVDLYDARVGGGIAAQDPPPPPEPCEEEACKPGATPPPVQPSPATPGFQGPGNVHEKPKPPCPKGKVRRHGRCVPKHKHQHNHHGRTHR